MNLSSSIWADLINRVTQLRMYDNKFWTGNLQGSMPIFSTPNSENSASIKDLSVSFFSPQTLYIIIKHFRAHLGQSYGWFLSKREPWIIRALSFLSPL